MKTFLLLTLVSVAFSAEYCSVSHGVGSGEATESSVMIWSRASCEGAYMHVKVRSMSGHVKKFTSEKVTSKNDDKTMRMKVTGLYPYTKYTYYVAFSRSETVSEGTKFETGMFRTAARATAEKPLKIMWMGDISGQNVCADKKDGFPLVPAMAEEHPDVLVLSGDMIYADGVCSQIGTYGNEQVIGDFNYSANLRDFREHWAYNRENKAFRDMLAQAQALVAWDDHEVVNDFGPAHDTRPNRAAGDQDPIPPYTPDVHLMPMGLRSMYDWNPFEADMKRSRHYGSYRYGKHVEIFRIDTRLYRDANLLNDTDNFPKTMLGLEQLYWLKQAIMDSDATWKIVQSSVPISIPTGSVKYGRDGWSQGDATSDGPNRATKGGFEREFRKIIDAFQESESHNVVFLTADVHFASVFEYPQFASNFWEGVVGPLNAGHFLKDEYDTDVGGVKRHFHYGLKWPESKEMGWDKIKEYFNYGTVEVDASAMLTMKIKNMNGVLYEKTLTPVAPNKKH